MVNPQISKKNADDGKRGIPKYLLCAPFALALTAAIPMGVAYADEAAPSVDEGSSSSAVEVVQESSDATSSETESSQESSTEDSTDSSDGESSATDADASATEDEALEFDDDSAAAPAAPAAPRPSSSSSSSNGDSGDSSEGLESSDLPDGADAEAVDPAEKLAEEDVIVTLADGQTESTITGEYKQSEARKTLDMVNADRKKTNGSQALTWDYALEQYAMQRAAEIAYSFSHTRPNGAAFSDEIMRYGYYSVGENIHMATGTNSHGAAKANQAWIDSAGHHANRTKAKWQGYAAACFYIPNATYYRNGVAVTGPMWCWVELFSTPNGNPNYSAPVDGTRTVTVVLNGENHQVIEGMSDDGKNPYSLGWWYDEEKDRFTYITAITYTSYVPLRYGNNKDVSMINGREYIFDQEGFITKESEKNLPFTREEFLGLAPSAPGQDPTKPPQSASRPNQGSNGAGTSNPNARPVINTKSSRSQESLTRVTPGAVQDEYGYTLYVTSDVVNGGAHWETNGNRTVFRLADGSLATGWVVDSGQRFYLDPSGEMAKGWRRINGAWYFFDMVDGTMKTGAFEYNGDRYFMDEKGAMQTGWVEIGGQRYYADLSGAIREA